LKIEIYSFLSRSTLIDENTLNIIDDFLIRIAHDESIYDVLVKIYEGHLDDIINKLNDDELAKLKRYHYLVLKKNDARKILKAINKEPQSPDLKYIVIKVANK